MELTSIDWLIIVAYFIATMIIGLAFAGRAGKSLTDYFVSGRSLPWWIAGTSMVATTFAADTPLAVTGLIAKNGLAGNWFWWSFALGGMFTVFVFSKLWRRAEVITDVEFIELRYGGKPAAALRGIRAGYFALIVNPIIIGWVTKAMIDFLHYTVFYDSSMGPEVSSSTQDWLIILGLFLAVGIYCSVSGMWGVAITDVIQFVLAMFGCIWLAIVAVNHVGGVEELQVRVSENFADEKGFEVFSFIPSFFGSSAWLPFSSFLIMVGVQWWASWYPGAEPGGGGYVVQRMAACRDETHALKATLWFQIAHYCIRPWPWIMVALVALALYPELHAMENAGIGFPMVIRDVAPTGLRGLIMVTFFAAFMSTISTQMNWGASLLVRDIYQRFLNPDASQKHLALASKIGSVLILALGIVVAFIMIDHNVSVDSAWKFLAALGAGGGLVYMLRWFWWRINAWSEIAGMFGSPFFFSIYYSEDLISEIELIFIVAVPTILFWLVVTLITPPEPKKILVNFYEKVHPGGPGWRPIASLAPHVKPDSNLGLSVLGAAVGSGVVYSLLWSIGRMIFQDYQNAAVGMLVAIVCGVTVFGIVRKLTQPE